MNRYGFYKEFIKGCNLRLKELFNELHSAYKIRNDLYLEIEKNRELFRILNINFDSVSDMLTKEHFAGITLDKRAKSIISSELVKTIGIFNYTCNTRISKIKHELKLVRLLSETPEPIYFEMQYWLNREIGNSIVRGDAYNFGQGLSRLGISYVLRSPNSKPIMDWGASNKLKKQLIEEGHTVKTAETPNGIKWLLFRTDAGYCFWKWLKRESFVPNKKMYRFRAIRTDNECTDYQGKLSQEQILDKSIGTFDKMMAMLKLNPLIINKYDF